MCLKSTVRGFEACSKLKEKMSQGHLQTEITSMLKRSIKIFCMKVDLTAIAMIKHADFMFQPQVSKGIWMCFNLLYFSQMKAETSLSPPVLCINANFGRLHAWASLSHTSQTFPFVVDCTPESFSPTQWHWQSSQTSPLMVCRQSAGFETLFAWMTFSRSCCKRSPAVNWVRVLCPFPCESCWVHLGRSREFSWWVSQRNLWETTEAELCCLLFKLLITWKIEFDAKHNLAAVRAAV